MRRVVGHARADVGAGVEPIAEPLQLRGRLDGLEAGGLGVGQEEDALRGAEDAPGQGGVEGLGERVVGGVDHAVGLREQRYLRGEREASGGQSDQVAGEVHVQRVDRRELLAQPGKEADGGEPGEARLRQHPLHREQLDRDALDASR